MSISDIKPKMNLTSENVIKIFDRMMKNHGVSYQKNKIMEVISLFSMIFNSVNQKKLANESSITIFNRIKFNFDIGSNDLPLWTQLKILAHELRHVEDSKEDPLMLIKYIKSSNRALYEIKAFSINLELDLWLNNYLGKKSFSDYTKVDLSERAKEYANNLKNYLCSDSDILSAYWALFDRAKIIVNLHQQKRCFSSIVEELLNILVEENIIHAW